VRLLALLPLTLFPLVTVCAQNCPVRSQSGPAEASVASTLHGTILRHDELREWFGLKLEQPVCGQDEIQLVFSDIKAQRRAETFRECAVSASGKLFDVPTGYYSAEIAISDPILEPDSTCHPFAVKPDLTTIPIPTDLKSFHASITVDYRGKGHIKVSVWRGANKEALQPWQAFVYYLLTGGQDVLWFSCHDGFSIRGVTQTPKSRDGFVGDAGAPGTVLQDMRGVNTVEFICTKQPKNTPSKEK